MHIMYLANHGPHDNQDEDAITHAFEELGHTVIRVEEHPGRRPVGTNLTATGMNCDLCLFHKTEIVSDLAAIPCPKVGWYFDMVANDHDPTLTRRMAVRRKWFGDVLPHCLLMFCTDGDWVSNSGLREQALGKHWNNLRWLMQGADGRNVSPLLPLEPSPAYEILFTGMIHHGRARADHVEQLKRAYGTRFTVMGDSGPRYRVHGRRLAEVFARTSIVVAPDGPNTDYYWSNRVYLTAGLGGFLLHPFCKGLASHYYPWKDIQYYDNRDHLLALIEEYLPDRRRREELRERAWKRTVESNLYVHRVGELLRRVKLAQYGKPDYV